MTLRFGALSPKLHEQVDFSEEELKLEQRWADGITICHIHGILTDAEAHKARKRIVKHLERKYKEKSKVKEEDDE